jgi:imidazolonepropionase-like amidohydrolase
MKLNTVAALTASIGLWASGLSPAHGTELADQHVLCLTPPSFESKSDQADSETPSILFECQTSWCGTVRGPAAAIRVQQVELGRGDRLYPSIAFVGAKVLPMDRDVVLDGYTVVVKGGHVTALGPDASTAVPVGALRINARGRWIMPGLVDFHTHEQPFTTWPDDIAGNFVMYMANSVTTIVNMGDFSNHMPSIAAAVKRGQLTGPNVYAGLFARGASDGGNALTLARNTSEAEALAANAAQRGYDFIKPYSGISPAVFDTLFQEGSRHGLGLAGHLASAVPFSHHLGRNRILVHGSEVLYSALGGQLNAEQLPSLAQQIRVAGADFNATLHVWSLINQFGLDVLAQRDPWQRVLSQEGVEYMEDAAIAGWARMFSDRPDLQIAVDRSAALNFYKEMTRQFSDAGIRIVVGTDTIGIPGVVPGFSIHGELQLMQEAGLSGYRVLESATRHSAEAMYLTLGRGEMFGVIRVGARADLVLLDSDPREHLDTLRRPEGVMVFGRYYNGGGLRLLLEELRNR